MQNTFVANVRKCGFAPYFFASTFFISSTGKALSCFNRTMPLCVKPGK